MPMINVTIEDRPGIVVISITGEFSLANIKKVEDVWQAQIGKSPGIIAINCRGLEYIDSSAIGTLVKFLNNAMNKKIKLVFYDLQPSISHIFKAARLNNFFTITTKERFEKEYIRGN